MKSRSFRSQLIFLMTLIVLLQSLALTASLWVAKVYDKLDAESFRLFDSAVSSRLQNFNRSAAALIANTSSAAGSLAGRLEASFDQNEVDAASFLADDGAFSAAEELAAQAVLGLLRSNDVTGAFVLFESSRWGTENGHSGVYIRDSSPDTESMDNSRYQLLAGSTNISKRYNIALGGYWDVDYSLPAHADAQAVNFYLMPVYASQAQPWKVLQSYGYWSPPAPLFDDGQQVVCYTLPLVGEDGGAFGVIGFEISLSYFARHYLPNEDLTYQNSFFALVNVEDDAILLDWFIPSGPVAQVHLKKGESLALEGDYRQGGMVTTEVGELGKMYCSLQALQLYDRNSIFMQDTWYLSAFVSQQALHEASRDVRNILMLSIVFTTVAAIVAILFISSFSTRKIKGLSQYVNGLSPAQAVSFQPTGMREIDDLTAALQTFNRSALNAAQVTSKIMDLTLLPMGCFEVTSSSRNVFLTDYIYKLLDLPLGATISMAAWREYYRELTARPDESTEDVYIYAAHGQEQLWLRIVESDTDSGYVGVILDVTKDMQETSRLKHELDYDGLTHLYNRNAFKRQVNAMIRHDPGKIGAMIFADLDNLKHINDRYGHEMGDRLLVEAARTFRSYEIYGGVVSRISGDEFAIYIHGYDDKARLRQLVVEQFEKNKQEELFTGDGNVQKIRSSAGIAWYPDDSDEVNDLLKLSDYAMYEAKNQNKGTIQEFSRESYRQNMYIVENKEIINRLLEEELIRFAFQPIVDLHTGELYAYEALMRSQLPEFNSPAEILSVAASQSKMQQLEKLVIFKVHREIQERREEIGGKKIFINSIPGTQLSPEDCRYLAEHYPELRGNAVVEITEEQSSSIEKFRDKVGDIRQLGYSLAIDDFGAGYSNEMRILTAEPDIVKIDMNIIQGIHKSPDLQNIARNVIGFCRTKGIKTVAEGVEEEADLLAVMRLGVDYVQGFYLGYPEFEFRQIAPEVADLIAREARRLEEQQQTE